MNNNAKERIHKRRYELIKEEANKTGNDAIYYNKKEKSSVLSFLSSLCIIASIALGVLIYGKNDVNGKWLKDNFGIEFSFAKINETMSKYTDYLLDFDIFSFLKKNDLPVNYEPDYTYLGNNNYEASSNMITSIGEGTVVFVGEENEKHIIIIQHDLGYTASYFGLEECFVKKYDRVNDKDNIGSSYEYISIKFEKDSEEISYEEVVELLS